MGDNFPVGSLKAPNFCSRLAPQPRCFHRQVCGKPVPAIREGHRPRNLSPWQKRCSVKNGGPRPGAKRDVSLTDLLVKFLRHHEKS